MESKILKELCFEDRCGIYGIPAIAEDFDVNKTRYLRITDISEDGKLLNDNKKSVSADNIDKYILEEGDIVFARTGNSTGKAYFHENINGRLAFAGFLIKYSLNPKLVNPKYLRYYTITDHYKQWVENFSLGSTRGNINAQSFGECPIPLPNRSRQDSLVKVLSDLDAKIEVNNKINQELEAMAKTIYDYWFVQFDFPNANGKPYKSSGGKMVYNEELKREIPEGWKVETIGDYCKSTGGYAFKSTWWSETGVPVVKIKDIQEDNTINTDAISYADLSGKVVDEKFICNPGDVLIAMTGATVGKFGVVPYTEKPLYVNQRVGYFNLGEEPTSKLPFLINSLNQKYFREVVFVLASGAAQPNISNEQINNIKLTLPIESFIQSYNDKMKPYYDKILNNQKENQKLVEFRDWLLPMLMNGQVTVVEAEEQLGMVAEDGETYKS